MTYYYHRPKLMAQTFVAYQRLESVRQDTNDANSLDSWPIQRIGTVERLGFALQKLLKKRLPVPLAVLSLRGITASSRGVAAKDWFSLLNQKAFTTSLLYRRLLR